MSVSYTHLCTYNPFQMLAVEIDGSPAPLTLRGRIGVAQGNAGAFCLNGSPVGEGRDLTLPEQPGPNIFGVNYAPGIYTTVNSQVVYTVTVEDDAGFAQSFDIGHRFANRLDVYIPVSYTHLDVYKRQDTERALLVLNSDIRYVLEHADKYIRPLQDKGRKVCLSREGNGSGLVVCNLTYSQIADFTAQVKACLELYDLDGVNFFDRNAGYGQVEGMPEMNTTSYPKLIKAMREAMPDKLLTLADYEEPTEYRCV